MANKKTRVLKQNLLITTETSDSSTDILTRSKSNAPPPGPG